MTSVVIVGASLGDEGKGKICDFLSEKADIIVRFQGGNNAGHTLVINGIEFKLSCLPAGVVRKNKLSVIGNGVVIDPWALLNEIEVVRTKGVTVSPENLKIAENACIILPSHGLLDRTREEYYNNSTNKIGTTGRGIGPAYEDMAGRRAIRVCDLTDHAGLSNKLDRLLLHHNAILKGFNQAELDKNKIMNSLIEISPKILPYSYPIWRLLHSSRKEGKKILYEGAQGILLDVNYGAYPYVTSSHTTSGAAATGSGVGVGSIDYVLGIAKAYMTQVGAGPFPTHCDDEIGELLGQRGKEFGVVTGRKRKCGWFDAVAVHQAGIIGGMNGIALTKLDILDSFDEIKICIAYRYNDEILDHIPADTDVQLKLEPVYETFPGWKANTRGARSWKELPALAIKYIRRLEELIELPIVLLSTSPEREDTILMKDPFIK